MLGNLIFRAINEKRLIVDFAIGAIETGATEHTAQSIVKRSGAKEGKVLIRSQDDVRQNAICRDGVNDNNIFSCLLLQKPFNIPSVSSVSPIKIDNLTLQLCYHPDRQKVDYVLNGFRYGFRLGFHPEITTLKFAKANCPSAVQHPSICCATPVRNNRISRQRSLLRSSFWAYFGTSSRQFTNKPLWRNS